jgi:hypothetical protein
MTTPTPIPDQNSQTTKTQETLPSLFNSISGAGISGGFAIALYFLTSSIAQTFSSKPIASSNSTAIRISVAVRTLVVGMSTLATTVFGIIALGLVFVSIVVLIQQLKNPKTPSA